MNNDLSIEKAFKESFDGFKNNIGYWIGVIFSFFVISGILFAIYFLAIFASKYFEEIVEIIRHQDLNRARYLFENFFAEFSVIDIIITIIYSLVSAVISIVFTGIFYKLSLNSIRGVVSSFNNILPSLGQLISIFIASIFYSIVISIGFLLCIIPGVIFAIKLSLYPYFILDGKGPVEALSASWEATKGQGFSIFAIYVVFAIAMGILYLCTCGLGLFIAYPMMYNAMAFIYVGLIAKPLETQQEAIPR